MLPLVIGDNKSALVHSDLLFWKVESEIRADGNPESQQTLKRWVRNKSIFSKRDREFYAAAAPIAATDKAGNSEKNYLRLFRAGAGKITGDIRNDSKTALREIVDYIGGDWERRIGVVSPTWNRKANYISISPTASSRAWDQNAFRDELQKCAEKFGGYALKWVEKPGSPSND